MSKPEFSKPFNILDAKAGAPYCCRDGQQAEILKWDCNHQRFPLIGVVCEKTYHYPESWTVSGEQASDEEFERRPGRDLVMLPIGMCQSKPIFMGDELVTRFGDKFVVEAKHIGYLDEENTWPVPTPAYPVTLMTDGDLVSNYYDGGPVSHEQEYQAWRRIANAALRHAIDVGQVMLPGAGHDAKHDLEIAEAAAKAVYNKVYQFGRMRTAYCDLGLNMPAIIASVTGAKDAKEGAQ